MIRKTILVVDDHDGIRTVIRTVLAKSGYDVLTAGDGIRALSVAEESEHPISLLITDIRMPNMNGIVLSDLLVAKFPSMAVLYISGFCNENGLKERLARARTAFLEKPFDFSTLLSLVDELLRSRPGASSAMAPASRRKPKISTG